MGLVQSRMFGGRRESSGSDRRRSVKQWKHLAGRIAMSAGDFRVTFGEV